MADDATEAIGIIGALREAGLLRTAPIGTPESPASATSDTIRTIGALLDAGLLGPLGLTVPPDPLPGPQIGDIVRARDIRQVFKRIDPDGSKGITFLSKQEGGRWWQIECGFPPNDNHWLVEIDNVLASPKPSVVNSVQLEVTHVIRTDDYSTMFEGKLKELRSSYRTPDLPLWTGQ